MRENGYVKGSRSYYKVVHTSDVRSEKGVFRKIIGQFELEAGETYYIRFKSCTDSYRRELYLDYFEWVPEKVYDNPNEPEDQW